MYHEILVPLDGSKRAEAILGHVEDIARGNDATLIFLKVEEEPKHRQRGYTVAGTPLRIEANKVCARAR